MNVSERTDLVREYYKKVDEQDLEWVLDLFDGESCYRRAGAVYPDKASIEDFYRNDRKITGNHQVEELVADQKKVVAKGVFVGKGADGADKNVGFCDYWLFNDDKVVLRETFLSLGSEYVRR